MQRFDGDGMMKTMRFFAILVVVAMALSSCGRKYPFELNAKFTVTIDTPEGVKTASSVVNFKVVYSDPNFDFLRFPEEGVSDDFFKGEAITINVDKNRVMFVLLTSQRVNLLAQTLTYDDLIRKYGAIADAPIGTRKIQERIDELKSKGTVLDIPSELYLYFVTFDDIKNPDKLIKVDPANLAATFGPGYSLKSLTMSYTDEPVTTGKVIAAVGDGFFEKWQKRMLSDIDGVEWKKQKKEFRNIVYREAFISDEK